MKDFVKCFVLPMLIGCTQWGLVVGLAISIAFIISQHIPITVLLIIKVFLVSIGFYLLFGLAITILMFIIFSICEVFSK